MLPNGQLIAKMDKVLGVKLPRPPKNWLGIYENNNTEIDDDEAKMIMNIHLILISSFVNI